MERVPDKLPNTASRLIAMAVSLLGDAESVRREIGCSPADFRDYCDAGKEPSWPELDRLVSLIVREQGKQIAKNRQFTAAIRAKLRKDPG